MLPFVLSLLSSGTHRRPSGPIRRPVPLDSLTFHTIRQLANIKMLDPMILHTPKPTWLKTLEVSTLVLVSLIVAYSFASLLYDRFQARRSGQIKLPTPKSPPVTQGDEFRRQLLANVEVLPSDDGEFVQEKRFWQTVSEITIEPADIQLTHHRWYRSESYSSFPYSLQPLSSTLR